MDLERYYRERIDPDVAEARILELVEKRSNGLTPEETGEVLMLALKLCGACAALEVEIKNFLEIVNHFWPPTKPKTEYLKQALAHYLDLQELDPSPDESGS